MELNESNEKLVDWFLILKLFPKPNVLRKLPCSPGAGLVGYHKKFNSMAIGYELKRSRFGIIKKTEENDF